jgi:hypothetical protein
MSSQENLIEAEREAMVRAVVEKLSAAGAEISHGAMAVWLPPDFNYDPVLDDYTKYLAGADAAPIAEAMDTEPSDDAEQLRARADQAASAASALRSRITILTRERTAARSELSLAIAALTSRIPRTTPSELARSFCESEALLRQQNKDRDREPDQRVNRSRVDATAAYSHGGTADDFARKQMQTGYRRGGSPASRKGARLPSER